MKGRLGQRYLGCDATLPLLPPSEHQEVDTILVFSTHSYTLMLTVCIHTHLGTHIHARAHTPF